MKTRLKIPIKPLGCLLLTLLLTLSPFLSLPVSAELSNAMLDFYDENNIFYYDGSASSTNCVGTLGTYDGQPSAGLGPQNAAFVDTYHDIAEKLSIQYGIPWEAVMAQGILESASGTTRFARERNNFFGIAAYDSNPDAAWSFPSPEAGWEGYYRNIKRTATYRNHGAFNYYNDPYGYIVAIKAAGYATAPNYVQALHPIIRSIENRAREKGWLSSAELAEKYPEMAEHAAENQAGANLDSEAESVVSSAEECSTAGAGNKDVNATAINLSWPDNTHDKFDPKPEYTEALAAVGLNTYGERWVQIGASCDAFVATVLRYSGVDPNVVCCGAANMLNYFANHPDLYEEIPNIGTPENMQPGDIRARPGHVEIWVVLEDGTGRIASASHGGRTGDHARSYYANSSYRIFRPKATSSTLTEN